MRRWKPSKTKAREFAKTMSEIDVFCNDNGISRSANSDSYYFSINGINYRVSNHSVEASNSGAYAQDGTKQRELYHPNGRDADTVYIHASKTRIVEIYENLKAGKILNGRGYVESKA